MRQRGFTLIELLIALAIFAFLVLLAGPMYADFMGNSQIRNAAENTLTGVRVAQAHAVRGNKLAKFVIDPSATGGWAVYLFDEDAADYAAVASDSYAWHEGASRTQVTVSPADATEITFDGLGRIITNLDATSTIRQIDITNPSVSSPRPLRVAISTPDVALTGTKPGTKLCDPDPGVAAIDPRFCPPTS